MRNCLAIVLVCSSCGGSPVISPFGADLGVNSTWRREPHRGVDFAQHGLGEHVIAVLPGKVTKIRFVERYGWEVILEHQDFGRWTRYDHLATVTVREGDLVARGVIIGTTGLFWASAGTPHVHLELCLQIECRDHMHFAGVEDPLEYSVGCYDPANHYGDRALILTYPVEC